MELLELGKSTAKATKQGVKQTFSPIKMLQSMTQNPNALESTKKDGDKNGEDQAPETIQQGKNPKGTTPLDLNKLGEKYKDQEKQSLDAMRSRLFQLVKGDEQKAIEGRKREEQERLQKIHQEEEEKKRREQEKRQQDSQQNLPQGKVRKTIGAVHKQKAQEAHQEVKANRSKG